METIGHIALMVREYDEAIEFYVGKLGFQLSEDTDLGSGKRWVSVRPAGQSGAGLVLSKAVTPEQMALVGNQTGGKVFLFVETGDFHRDHERLMAGGVTFCEKPRHEAYGTVVVFEDLYGNKIDLIQRHFK